MPVLTKINTNVIADDAITAEKYALEASGYVANTTNQNLSGTYAESRMYTSDAYTLTGDTTVNANLVLSSVKGDDSDITLTTDSTTRTITGTGVLSGGSFHGKQTLTGMAGELGSGATLGSAVTGTVGSGVTGGSGLDRSQAGTGAFAARRASGAWISIDHNALVGFDNASTGDSFDTDGNYATATRSYVAPADGVYLFWFAIYTAYSDTTNGFNFWIDEAEVDFQEDTANWFTVVTGHQDDMILNATIVLPLAFGNHVTVRGAMETDYYSPYSQWGGVRLR